MTQWQHGFLFIVQLRRTGGGAPSGALAPLAIIQTAAGVTSKSASEQLLVLDELGRDGWEVSPPRYETGQAPSRLDWLQAYVSQHAAGYQMVGWPTEYFLRRALR